MRTAIVIPARYQSSRLVGKPLRVIAGRSMLERVWKIAQQVQNIQDVIIATDDQRIFDLASSFGAQVLMTPENCKNGSERVFAALKHFPDKFDAVINLQGDAPLTPPWVVQAVADGLQSSDHAGVVTAAVQLSQKKYEQIASSTCQTGRAGTFVTFDNSGNALYFSRSLIPAIRKWPANTELSPAYQHIGIYGYSLAALKDYLELPESRLEQIEGLEQLRLLDNGRKIKVIEVDYKNRTHWSVDNESDLAIVADIIEREGELL